MKEVDYDLAFLAKKYFNLTIQTSNTKSTSQDNEADVNEPHHYGLSNIMAEESSV